MPRCLHASARTLFALLAVLFSALGLRVGMDQKVIGKPDTHDRTVIAALAPAPQTLAQAPMPGIAPGGAPMVRGAPIAACEVRLPAVHDIALPAPGPRLGAANGPRAP